MRLRQVALVARELERSVEDLCDVLGVDVAYNDSNMVVFGLVNAVMPVGNTFLEVVSPAQEGTTAGRYLERRGGDGGYMLVLQTRDLGRERERIEKLGVRVAWEVDIGRAKVIHLHPRDIGSSLVSFDQMSQWDAWEWAGPDWGSKVRRDSTTGIVAAELQSEDPELCAARWSEVLDIPRRGFEIPLDEGTLRFVEVADGRGEGLGGIDVAATDAPEVLKRARNRGLPIDGNCITLCGTRVRLV
jgi:catechol 2,3-dioxygenase-like lactoylglutathione lyase family enzyme